MADYKLHAKAGVYDADGNYIAPKKGDPKWDAYMKWFRLGNLPDPPDAVEVQEPSLDEVKNAKMAQVDRHAGLIRMRFLLNISPAEMSSWVKKEELARNYILSEGSSDPGFLLLEAEARQISMAALAIKIVEKADLYYQLEAVVSGVNGRHNDAIKLLPTKEDVESYDFSTGWPNI